MLNCCLINSLAAPPPLAEPFEVSAILFNVLCLWRLLLKDNDQQYPGYSPSFISSKVTCQRFVSTRECNIHDGRVGVLNLHAKQSGFPFPIISSSPSHVAIQTTIVIITDTEAVETHLDGSTVRGGPNSHDVLFLRHLTPGCGFLHTKGLHSDRYPILFCEFETARRLEINRVWSLLGTAGLMRHCQP